MIQFQLDGQQVEIDDEACSLLEALRDRLGVTGPKDGCSPQGQCGCCTVLVDGEPRVSCVTALRRVAGREVTTVAGLAPDVGAEWAEAFCATGASQCGFCTPGIIVRLEALRRADRLGDRVAVERGLAAHLCRCTGWEPIFDAAELMSSGDAIPTDRDLAAATRRASIESGGTQVVSAEVPLGRGGFADDIAPTGALVAVRSPDGEWVVAATLSAARATAGAVPGRRTTVPPTPPLPTPAGEWVVVLRTSWVEPAYLETDASWCEPGGEPVSPLANGGAFGAKESSDVGGVARRLADEHGRPVRVRWSREDTVRFGPKRPPVAIGVRSDGTGVVVVARTPGIVEAIASVAPGLIVTEVDVAGPPTSAELRGAGWVEAAVAVAAATGSNCITSPDGAWASAAVAEDGSIAIEVGCGEPLDDIVLRSYCIGAAHAALGWVTSEGLAVDDDGTVLDLTIRSFGIVRPGEMVPVHVDIVAEDGPPVCGSDAVFAAVALAVWKHRGLGQCWPMIEEVTT